MQLLAQCKFQLLGFIWIIPLGQNWDKLVRG